MEECRGDISKVGDKVFAELLRVSIEVYIDDMLVKSEKTQDHVTHLDQTFFIL